MTLIEPAYFAGIIWRLTDAGHDIRQAAEAIAASAGLELGRPAPGHGSPQGPDMTTPPLA